MAFIGIGKCSKYYLYIFIVIFCQFICDYLTEFNKDNEEEYKSSEEKKDSIINHTFIIKKHYLIQDLLKFIGMFICGLLLYIFFYKHIEENKDREMSIVKYQAIKDKYFGNKKSINFSYSLFLIGFFYSLNTMLRTFCISLNFDAGFWTLEILFVIFLSYKYLKISIGNHQKVTIFILAVVLFIFQIISSLLPRTKHKCEEGINCKEKYYYDNNLYIFIEKKFGNFIYIPIILITYIINFIMRDYSWVKSKYLMDIKTIPMYKILFFIGTIGIILVIISLSFASSIPCSSFKNVNIYDYTYNDTNNGVQNIMFSKEICNLMDFNENTKELKFYYDNFFTFLKDYKENGILEILTLPIYLIMYLIISYSQIMMLKNLDSIILLVNINFNYFIGRLIFYIINGAKEEYLTFPLFVLLELQELLAIFAYLIYMEIIELKFCKLDYDLKKSIQIRSIDEFDSENYYELEENEKEEEKKETPYE